MAAKNPLVTPILKWAGGKRQLLDYILPLIPPFSTYYEPFVGGGALLFCLQPKKAVINDSNCELMNVYQVIQNTPGALIKRLLEHQEKNCEAYFYHIRSMDRDKNFFDSLSDVERAARMIYLNKTCYNGLFRVNSSGEFNAPFGRYKNPGIINETTIMAMSSYFNYSKMRMLCGDYKDAIKGVRKDAFVYFDPPYMPVSASSSFTGYTSDGFHKEEQIALKKQCDRLNKRGIRFLLSNSCCPFIEDLYKDYKIERVFAKRAINADADKRGAIQEVLIRNYEID